FGNRLQGQTQVEADFAVGCPIEAFALVAGVEIKAPDDINHLDQHDRDDKGVRRRCQGRHKLDPNLRHNFRTGLHHSQVTWSVRIVDQCLPGENAGEYRAEETTHAVDAEGVERIVVFAGRLQEHRSVADAAGEQADG